MDTIWRFPIDMQEAAVNSGRITIKAPLGAKILHVDLQQRAPHQPSMWVQLDEEREPVLEHHFEVVGTGHPVPKGGIYVGTWQEDGYVWHLYEVT
jgi:hypothetical protein